jgi:hypothetical protein
MRYERSDKTQQRQQCEQETQHLSGPSHLPYSYKWLNSPVAGESIDKRCPTSFRSCDGKCLCVDRLLVACVKSYQGTGCDVARVASALHISMLLHRKSVMYSRKAFCSTSSLFEERYNWILRGTAQHGSV